MYNPLPGIPKYTGDQPQVLQANGRDINIPKDTLVVPNLMALHTRPRYWGEDSLIWRPSRWIESSFTPTSPVHVPLATRLRNESIMIPPPRGSFIAWSEGMKNCPIKKFTQVEFVATMAAVFRNHKAQPVVKHGKTLDEARVRVLNVVKYSTVELLLQMRDPDGVALTWAPR